MTSVSWNGSVRHRRVREIPQMNARYALINATPWIRDGGRKREREREGKKKRRNGEVERGEGAGWMTSSLLSSRWRGVDKVSPRGAIGGQDQAGCYFLLSGAGASLSPRATPFSPLSSSQPASPRPLCAFYSLPAPGSPYLPSRHVRQKRCPLSRKRLIRQARSITTRRIEEGWRMVTESFTLPKIPPPPLLLVA